MSCEYNWEAFTPTHEAAIPEAGRWRLSVTHTVIWVSLTRKVAPVNHIDIEM